MNDLFNKFLQENNLVVIEKDKEVGGSNRGSPKYREWRKQVLERDGHRCQCCGGDKHLVAHHIFNYKDYPLLRCSVDNGITLCKWCHGKYHSYYGKKANAHTLMEYYKRFECNEISRVEKEPEEPVPVLDTPETRFLKEYYVEDVQRTHWLSNKEICDKYQEYCAQNHIPINQKSMMANMRVAISKVFGNIKHRKSKGMRYPLKLKEEVTQLQNSPETGIIPKKETTPNNTPKVKELTLKELYKLLNQMDKSVKGNWHVLLLHDLLDHYNFSKTSKERAEVYLTMLTCAGVMHYDGGNQEGSISTYDKNTLKEFIKNYPDPTKEVVYNAIECLCDGVSVNDYTDNWALDWDISLYDISRLLYAPNGYVDKLRGKLLSKGGYGIDGYSFEQLIQLSLDELVAEKKVEQVSSSYRRGWSYLPSRLMLWNNPEEIIAQMEEEFDGE